MGLGLDGFRNCESSQRGSLTGKNPTDRAKLGVKFIFLRMEMEFL
ncbi:hypothetical protein [Leptospira borgpetersenii]|nr:hypothetical protein [Leptospira borgpetersenii]